MEVGHSVDKEACECMCTGVCVSVSVCAARSECRIQPRRVVSSTSYVPFASSCFPC